MHRYAHPRALKLASKLAPIFLLLSKLPKREKFRAEEDKNTKSSLSLKRAREDQTVLTIKTAKIYIPNVNADLFLITSLVLYVSHG